MKCWKKLFSLALCLILSLAVFPISASADEEVVHAIGADDIFYVIPVGTEYTDDLLPPTTIYWEDGHTTQCRVNFNTRYFTTTEPYNFSNLVTSFQDETVNSLYTGNKPTVNIVIVPPNSTIEGLGRDASTTSEWNNDFESQLESVYYRMYYTKISGMEEELQIPVAGWNCLNYSEKILGTFQFTSSYLLDPQHVKDNCLTNPSETVPSITVNTQRTVNSSLIARIAVPLGTPADAVIAPFQYAEVPFYDGTRDIVKMNWKPGEYAVSYNPDVVGSNYFSARTEDPYIHDNWLDLGVTVMEQFELSSVAYPRTGSSSGSGDSQEGPTTIKVPKNADLSAYLPEFAYVHENSEYSYIMAFPVTWDTSGINLSQYGMYTAKGVMALPDCVENPANLQPSIQVEVCPSVTSIQDAGRISFTPPAKFKSISFPEIQVTIDDGSTITVPAVWNSLEYDGLTTRVVHGSPVLPENILNPQGLDAAVTLIAQNGEPLEISPRVVSGQYHVVGLSDDGTITAALSSACPAGDQYGQADVAGWNDLNDPIVYVDAEYDDTAAITASGLVLTTGWTASRTADGVTNSDAIAQHTADKAADGAKPVRVTVGYNNIAVLYDDGTVFAVTAHPGNTAIYDTQIADELNTWTGIQDIAIGKDHVIARKTDGSFAAYGNNAYGQTDLASWGTQTILPGSLDADVWGSTAVTESGSILCAGWGYVSALNFTGAQDMVQVSSNNGNFITLDSHNTARISYNYQGTMPAPFWTDVVSVGAGFGFYVGLKSDGTILSNTLDAGLQSALNAWDLIA